MDEGLRLMRFSIVYMLLRSWDGRLSRIQFVPDKISKLCFCPATLLRTSQKLPRSHSFNYQVVRRRTSGVEQLHLWMRPGKGLFYMRQEGKQRRKARNRMINRRSLCQQNHSENSNPCSGLSRQLVSCTSENSAGLGRRRTVFTTRSSSTT